MISCSAWELARQPVSEGGCCRDLGFVVVSGQEWSVEGLPRCLEKRIAAGSAGGFALTVLTGASLVEGVFSPSLGVNHAGRHVRTARLGSAS